MTTMIAGTRTTALARVLDDNTRQAWQRYLDDTRDLPAHRYEQTEPWAWIRLWTELRSIDARRKALL